MKRELWQCRLVCFTGKKELYWCVILECAVDCLTTGDLRGLLTQQCHSNAVQCDLKAARLWLELRNDSIRCIACRTSKGCWTWKEPHSITLCSSNENLVSSVCMFWIFSQQTTEKSNFLSVFLLSLKSGTVQIQMCSLVLNESWSIMQSNPCSGFFIFELALYLHLGLCNHNV